jgi:hypothetical protein
MAPPECLNSVYAQADKRQLAGPERRLYKPRIPHCGIGGVWLSLVEHLVRDEGVVGSNPITPTSFFPVSHKPESTATSGLNFSGFQGFFLRRPKRSVPLETGCQAFP